MQDYDLASKNMLSKECQICFVTKFEHLVRSFCDKRAYWAEWWI